MADASGGGPLRLVCFELRAPGARAADRRRARDAAAAADHAGVPDAAVPRRRVQPARRHRPGDRSRRAARAAARPTVGDDSTHRRHRARGRDRRHRRRSAARSAHDRGALEPPPREPRAARSRRCCRASSSTPTGSVRVLDASAILTAEPLRALARTRRRRQDAMTHGKLRVPDVLQVPRRLPDARGAADRRRHVRGQERDPAQVARQLPAEAGRAGSGLHRARRPRHDRHARAARGRRRAPQGDGQAADRAPATAAARRGDRRAATRTRAMYDALSRKNGVAARPVRRVHRRRTSSCSSPPASRSIEHGRCRRSPRSRRRATAACSRTGSRCIDGVPYQVSALPIRAPTATQVVGGMLIGVKLQRYFDEFAEQSDDRSEHADPADADRRHDDPRVGVAARSPRRARARDAARQVRARRRSATTSRDVIRLKDGDFDFLATDGFEGYKAGDAGTVGKLVITRSRATLVDPASKLPWLEILVGIGASIVDRARDGVLDHAADQAVRASSRATCSQGDTDLTQRIVVISSRDETARPRREHQPGVRARCTSSRPACSRRRSRSARRARRSARRRARC